MRWSRRRLLQGFGGAAGTALLGCRPSPDDEATPSTEAFAMPGCPHDAIVSSLLAERVDALPVLQKWLLAKTSTDALYAAALVVGARTAVTEVDFHEAMVVNATYVMSKRVAEEQRLMPLFYVWNRERRAVAAQEGKQPALPPVDPAKVPAPADAAAALIAAFESWDAGAAEAAVVVLFVAGGREAVIGPLTRYALRNQHQLGHRAIWVAYAVRCLDALGWGCAPWVLRSLVRAINSNRARSSLAAYPASVKRLAEVPATYRDGKDDPAAVPPLLEILRAGDAAACVDAVLSLLSRGTSRRTI